MSQRRATRDALRARSFASRFARCEATLAFSASAENYSFLQIRSLGSAIGLAIQGVTRLTKLAKLTKIPRKVYRVEPNSVRRP